MKKYDERSVLNSIARIGKIDVSMKTIAISKNAIVGIHRLGKLDFLRHYCGWSVYRTNDSFIPKGVDFDIDKPTTKFERFKTKRA